MQVAFFNLQIAMNRLSDQSRRFATQRSGGPRQVQRGASLIELLVGIAIGLLVVLAALGTVVYTSASAGAVTDSVRLNLQAQAVFDTLGRQLRQSSSHTMSATGLNGVITFQNGLAPGTAAVSEVAGELRVRHSTNVPNAVPAFAPSAALPGCLGGNPGPGVLLSVNRFSNAAGLLRCDEGGGAQPIAENVEMLLTRYGVRNALTGNLQYAPAAAVVDWQAVEAVEICLQLQGDRLNNPNLAVYTNCQGVATPVADGRLHRVFRRIFTVRPDFQAG
jgi:type IV pilus assembly protein PilW